MLKKNPENPSCIDLFSTNSPNNFQNFSVVDTGLLDFHRMIVTDMETTFQRLLPKKSTIGITVTMVITFFGILCLMNNKNYSYRLSLRKKCLYSVLFSSVLSRIRTEYGEIRRISPYSVRMQENTDQNNSQCGHFSSSA